MSEGLDLRRREIPDVLTPKEAAAELGIALNTIYRGIRSGWCPSKRIGRQWRIDRASLEALRRQ